MAVVQRLTAQRTTRQTKSRNYLFTFLACVFITAVGLQGTEILCGLDFVQDAVDMNLLFRMNCYYFSKFQILL